MDNKTINNNVRILRMTFVFNFDTILPKTITGHFMVKEIVKPHKIDVILTIVNEL